MTDTEKAKLKKKIDPGTIKLVMAGDLLMARNPDRSNSGIFRRYEALLEMLANMEREERILNYKFLLALVFTSHAKKTKDIQHRKALFELKNGLFLNVVNNRSTRRKLVLRYLVSKNFRVVSFCSECETSNNKAGLERHDWKHCQNCGVDRKFYNVLAIHHKFEAGSATLFLSNDLIHRVENLKAIPKGRLEDFTEEALFQKYHYHVRNLDVFELESAKKVQARLLEIPVGPQ